MSGCGVRSRGGRAGSRLEQLGYQRGGLWPVGWPWGPGRGTEYGVKEVVPLAGMVGRMDSQRRRLRKDTWDMIIEEDRSVEWLLFSVAVPRRG